jgi:hypothetical protein
MARDQYALTFGRPMSTMIFYHRGAAFEPLYTRAGRTFVATASILEEDGNVTSLGKLGVFANKKGALNFRRSMCHRIHRWRGYAVTSLPARFWLGFPPAGEGPRHPVHCLLA